MLKLIVFRMLVVTKSVMMPLDREFDSTSQADDCIDLCSFRSNQECIGGSLMLK